MKCKKLNSCKRRQEIRETDRHFTPPPTTHGETEGEGQREKERERNEKRERLSVFFFNLPINKTEHHKAKMVL